MKQALKSLVSTKLKKPEKNWRLVGFFDSPDIHSQLLLMALGSGEAKSELLRRIVGEWLKKNNAVKSAVYKLKSFPEYRDPAFIKKLEKLLQKKGVTKDYITKVLKQLV